ncbi:neogenin-like [Stylophora pistillata]|uniref:neogenin-like n=1 Tax=Stylophora pistillata TaxID=50429 RepID=UPI000C044DFA|nr:neogenin-like [Stylophora pistillata]
MTRRNVACYSIHTAGLDVQEVYFTLVADGAEKNYAETFKVLIGNDDRNSEVKHVVYGVLTRYMRFLPKTHQGRMCMRTEVFGVEKMSTCNNKPIGLAIGGEIPDSSFVASSEHNYKYVAEHGRLNNYKSWGPMDNNNADDFLQIDLLYEYIICAVATQGNPKIVAPEWTTYYKIRLSFNDTTFDTYKENNTDKILVGNNDRNSEVKHVVYRVLTRYLRFLPKTHQRGVCMRTEVFGVKQEPTCEMEAIGLAFNGKIPNNSFTASSYFNDAYYKPSFGRLKGSKRGWAPKVRSKDGDYLQIDLLYEYVICAVATQGANGINEWTKSFKIQLSLDGTTFDIYQEDNNDMVFPGNSNQSGIIKNSLQEFASATFIRFQPIAYNIWKVLRVEVYGVLLTKVPSEPPSAFELTASTSTSITTSWQIPPVFSRHGRTITGFKLLYKKRGSGGSAITLTIRNGPTLSRSVTGLDKYTEYEFQVLAFTSDGDGAKSPVEVERTKEDVPSQAPSSLTVAAVTSTTITASWQLPPLASRNGIITGFKLFFKERASAGSVTTLLINSGSTLRRNVTGLKKYTEYEFQVLASTSVGNGPKSPSEVERTKEDVPSEPPSAFELTASTSTSITTSWQLPPVFSRHGRTITGFKLLYKKRGSGGSAITLTIRNGPTLSRSVTGLDKYTEYEFQVLAFTSDGDGAKSPVEVERTKEDVPSQAPSSLTVTAVTSTTITASWQLPPLASRNGMITGFKLFFKERASAGSVTTLLINSGSTLRRNVTGLKKYTEYEFQVLASTSVGNGPKSPSKVERTKEDVPSKAPSSFTVTAATSRTVTATWQLLTEDSRNGMIRGFKLFYQKSGSVGPATTLTFNNGTALGKDVTGLDKNTEYEFQVLAFTSVGDGPKSSVEVARTMKDGI